MAKFLPGQSGNPGGRPAASAQLTELARTKTEAAINSLAEIMLNKKAPAAARVTAACALLDRGYGRPNQTMEMLAHLEHSGLSPDLSDHGVIYDVARRLAFVMSGVPVSLNDLPANPDGLLVGQSSAAPGEVQEASECG